jgi:hypothetical protein
MLGGVMLGEHWLPISIYLVAATPLIVAALATICVRFSAAAPSAAIAAQTVAAAEHH